MQVHQVRRHPSQRRHPDIAEVPQEPGEPGRRHEQAGAALRSPLPRDEPAADEGPAHGQVGDPAPRVAPAEPDPLGGQAERDAGQPDQGKPPHHRPQPVRAARASPDSPLLGMNPRAGVALEAGTIGCRITAGDEHDRRRIRRRGEVLGHGEPIQIRQLDVEQDDRRAAGRRRLPRLPPRPLPLRRRRSPRPAATPGPRPGTPHDRRR